MPSSSSPTRCASCCCSCLPWFSSGRSQESRSSKRKRKAAVAKRQAYLINSNTGLGDELFQDNSDDKLRASMLSSHSIRRSASSASAGASASKDGLTGEVEGSDVAMLYGGEERRRKKQAKQRDDRLTVRVLLLDDTYQTFKISNKTKGQALFDLVCDDVNLWEKDYFCLRYQDDLEQLYWLDLQERVSRQLKVSPNFVCYLCVKYYIKEPTSLSEEITRYQFFLQLKRDIQYGRVLVRHDTAVHLFACAVQSELGDFNEEEFSADYISEFLFLPEECQTQEFEQEVMEQHRTMSGMVPAVAESAFLDRVRCLPLYGIDLHPVKGTKGTDVQVGVGHSGLSMFRNAKLNEFYEWTQIKKIQFKKTTFTLQVLPSDSKADSGDSLRYQFLAPSSTSCKELWRCCVAQHCFFRRFSMSPEKNISKTVGLLRSRSMSSLVHVPRTNYQVQEEVKKRKRTEPSFDRAPSRRSNRSLPAELEFPRSSHRWPRKSGASTSNISDVVLSPREALLRPIRRGTHKLSQFNFRRNSQSDKSSNRTATGFDSKPVSRAQSVPLGPGEWHSGTGDVSSDNEQRKQQELEVLRQTARTPIQRRRRSRTAWSSEDEDSMRPSTTSDQSLFLTTDVRNADRFSPAGASSGTPTAMLSRNSSNKRQAPSRNDSGSSVYRMMRRPLRVGAANPVVPCTPQSDLSLSASPRFPQWPWSLSSGPSPASSQYVNAGSPVNTYRYDAIATATSGERQASAGHLAAAESIVDTDEEHARRMAELWRECGLDAEDGEQLPLSVLRSASHLDSSRRYGVHSMFLDDSRAGGLGESSDQRKDLLPANCLKTEDFVGSDGDTDSTHPLPGQASTTTSATTSATTSPFLKRRRETHPKDEAKPTSASLQNRRKTVCVGLPMVTSSSNQSVDSGHPTSPVSPQVTPLTSKGSTMSSVSVPSTSSSHGLESSATNLPSEHHHRNADAQQTAQLPRAPESGPTLPEHPMARQNDPDAGRAGAHVRANGVGISNEAIPLSVARGDGPLSSIPASPKRTENRSHSSTTTTSNSSPSALKTKRKAKKVLEPLKPLDSSLADGATQLPPISPRSASLASRSNSFNTPHRSSATQGGGPALETSTRGGSGRKDAPDRSAAVGSSVHATVKRDDGQPALSVVTDDRTAAAPPQTSSQYRKQKSISGADAPTAPPSHPPTVVSHNSGPKSPTDAASSSRNSSAPSSRGQTLRKASAGPPSVSTDAAYLDDVLSTMNSGGGGGRGGMNSLLRRDTSKSSPALHSGHTPSRLAQRHQWFN